jgi:uncharacterized protein (TIGR00255 family)
MILSMTGYGRQRVDGDGIAATVEMRTVNHRFLDPHIRLNREYAFLEPELVQLIRQSLRRGRVDANVSVQLTNEQEFPLNLPAVRGYVQAAARLQTELGFSDSLRLDTLFSLPGVLQAADTMLEPSDELRRKVSSTVLDAARGALQGVIEMRRQEGSSLKADMCGYLDSIEAGAARIRELAPGTVAEYQKKLEERLSEILPQAAIDPSRVAQEVAILAERSDISEEIARLDSHVRQYREILQAGNEVGKKLDFLLQEMQREVNTTLSKTGNLEITRLAIGAKGDIEKLREQVQNVE